MSKSTRTTTFSTFAAAAAGEADKSRPESGESGEAGEAPSRRELEEEFNELAATVPIAYFEKNETSIRALYSSLGMVCSGCMMAVGTAASFLISSIESSPVLQDLLDNFLTRAMTVRRWGVYLQTKKLCGNFNMHAFHPPEAFYEHFEAACTRSMARYVERLQAEKAKMAQTTLSAAGEYETVVAGGEDGGEE
jgi:hypothetical protein